MKLLTNVIHKVQLTNSTVRTKVKEARLFDVNVRGLFFSIHTTHAPILEQNCIERIQVSYASVVLPMRRLAYLHIAIHFSLVFTQIFDPELRFAESHYGNRKMHSVISTRYWNEKFCKKGY